jgi:hypothetical protein
MWWSWGLLWIKQIFCNHKKQALGIHVWDDKKEIFCHNCKKILVPSWLYEKLRLDYTRFNVGGN